MVKRRGQLVRAAARPLIHADYVHPGGHTLFRDAKHVLRIARAFQPMNENQRERFLPFRLPMAMAEHLDSRLNFDQAFFGFGQREASGQQKACNCLNVAAAKESPWTKFADLKLPPRRCARRHLVILTGLPSAGRYMLPDAFDSHVGRTLLSDAF